jgi:hypothetical protein
MEFGIQFFPAVGARGGRERLGLDRYAGEIRSAIESYDRSVGGFECASLQVNFGMIGRAEAEASMLLFAREVMPHFT